MSTVGSPITSLKFLKESDFIPLNQFHHHHRPYKTCHFQAPVGEPAAPTPHGVRYKYPVAQVLRFSKSQESNAVNGTFTWLLMASHVLTNDQFLSHDQS